MVSLRWLTWTVVLVSIGQVQAQSDDLVGFFVSEAVSIYTGLTSAIASAQSAASASAASFLQASASSASAAEASSTSPADISETSNDGTATFPASTSDGFSSTTASSSEDFPTSTFRTTRTSASTNGVTTDSSKSSGAAAAAASETDSTGAASSLDGGGGSNDNLPIILGSVLGALALGLLILVFVICCNRRRRRHRSGSLSSRALSPGSVEVESWRQPSGIHDGRHGSNKEYWGTAPTAPLMSEHPAFKTRSQHENPFIPVPPPPRRSAPNARAGLTDGIVPGDDPYLEKETGQTFGRKSYDSSHTGRNLALGAGAMAAGALAMHHHDKKKDAGSRVSNSYAESTNRSITRKPVPANDRLSSGSWATPSTTANDDAFALNSTAGRQSSDSSRSRASRDAARANAAFDNEYAPIPDSDHNHGHHGAATAAALGAGAIGGAALAHHHHHSRSRSGSRSRSMSQTRTGSPHANLLLATPKRESDASNTPSDLSASSNSIQYSDASAHQSASKDAGVVAAPAGGYMQSPTNIPPAPPTRSRRSSALGAAAPAAAALSYVGSHHQQDHERSRSRSRPRSHPSPSGDAHFRGRFDHIMPNMPALIPTRSPARASFPAPHDYSYATTSFPDLPLSQSVHSAMNPNPQPTVSTPGLQNLHTSTGIVGDNRYPHMNIPRRKSGGEHDYTTDGSFLPSSVPLPAGMTVDECVGGGNESRKNSMTASRPVSIQQPSEDSTWRLSMGMPGGWQRSHSPGVRKSVESTRSPISPLSPGEPVGARDGFFMSGGAGLPNQNQIPNPNSNSASGRRLRLADLRRQEEEDMMLRMSAADNSSMQGQGDWGNSSGNGSGNHTVAGPRYEQQQQQGYFGAPGSTTGRGSGNGSGRYYEGVGVAR